VQARGAYQQAVDELETKQELNRRGADIVARREIEKLETAVKTRQGGVDAALSAKQGVETRISDVLPAQKASTEATLAEAEVELAKTVVRAGVTGRVEQFALQVGDIVIRWRAPPACSLRPHRIVRACRPFRSDRRAGHEARDGWPRSRAFPIPGRSSRWWLSGYRISSPPGNSAAANS